ncbi:MAG: ribosome maturation factor RimM [Candidatus Thiodiazotropha taylori]
MSDREMIIMGRVSGLFGVRGWIKIYSYTAPKEGILGYKQWYLKRQGDWQQIKVIAGHPQGKGIVAQLAGYDDRDRAAELIESEIAVGRDQLPSLPAGEYYWTDLEGLRVETLEGVDLGRISHLFETGANDVLVVKGDRERLIPYTMGEAVQRIDLEAGLMVVDWDPEF